MCHRMTSLEDQVSCYLELFILEINHYRFINTTTYLRVIAYVALEVFSVESTLCPLTASPLPPLHALYSKTKVHA